MNSLVYLSYLRMVLFIAGIRILIYKYSSILVHTIQTQKLGRCKYVCAYVLACM